MDQRNLLLAVVLSLGILLAFEMFLAPEPPVAPPQTAEQSQVGDQPSTSQQPGSQGTAGLSLPGGPTAAATAALDRSAALAQSDRVLIETPTLRGSIALTGARIDDLTLTRYRETVETGSPNIEYLQPLGTPRPYYVDFNWISTTPGLALPTAETVWQAKGGQLAPDNPVTLSWDNGQGQRFEQHFAVDEHYMFTVTQEVVNSGADSIAVAPYGLVSRTGTPEILGFYILHEGLLGVFDNTLTEIDYDDLQEDGIIKQSTTGGWLGITDKYWLAALIPDQQKTVETRFVHEARDGVDKYQTDLLYEPSLIPAGASTQVTSRFFAGAKEVVLLDQYQEDLAIPRFDRAVDFGWFYFLTKPLFYGLHYVAQVVGNFGISILILTIGIKLVFFPLANKSYSAMAKMRKLQPEMIRLREKYGEDKQRLNQEMMGLYKKEGANPMSGCLPIVIQIPVFFALYKVLFVTIEMRHAPFYGWIRDLSAQDPTTILNGFGLLPWDAPELGAFNMLNIGIWPLLMGITMFLQQRLNPQPPDPVQAKIFLFMPIIFTFLLASFPAGLVIYWTWNNLLSIIQQAVIMKRAGVPIGRTPAAPPSTGKT